MNKTLLHTNKLEKELTTWKRQDEELRQRRAEIMLRLRRAGYTYQRISNIYGCKRQFVQQEIKRYNEVIAA